MILHFIFNTLIVFLGLSLFIEIILRSFNCQNYRIRYFCRLLPFLKIPFDFFLFLTYGESLFLNLNPFSCEFYTFELIGRLFNKHFSLTSEHMILPQYIASFLPPSLLVLISGLVLMVTLGGTFQKTAELVRSQKFLSYLIQKADPCRRQIESFKLKAYLKKLKVTLLVSSDISIPFATGFRTILLPSYVLHAISQKEFEAIVAHEIEHLRWKDPIIKLACSFLASLFWWIPSKWALNRIYIEQERACDANVNNYGIEPSDLGKALLETVKRSKENRCDLISTSLLKFKHPHLFERLNSLCALNNRSILRSLITAIASVALFLSVSMC